MDLSELQHIQASRKHTVKQPLRTQARHANWNKLSKRHLHYASTFFKQLSSSVAVILLLGIYLKEIIRNSVKHLCPQETEIYVQSPVLKAYL